MHIELAFKTRDGCKYRSARAQLLQALASLTGMYQLLPSRMRVMPSGNGYCAKTAVLGTSHSATGG